MWLAIIVGLLLILIINKCLARPKDYPPGYWGLPLIGYIPLNKKTFEQNLLELREKNGNSPIISWRMGTKLIIFLFDNGLIREVFTGKDYVHRPKLRILGFLGGSDLGLIAGNGIPWQNSRRFTLQHLRDLGMGKSSLVPIIQYEAMEMVNSLKARAGKPAQLLDSIKVAALNVIWQMVASKRYASDDENLKKFYYLLGEFRKQSDNAMLVDFMPWIPTVLPKFLFKHILDEELEKKFGSHLKNMLKVEIAEHRAKLDIDSPGDYIDAYLAEMKRQENNQDSTFSEEDLIACTSDLFGTATETVSVTLQWIIFYVASFPEVQKNLQNEVDKVLPKGVHVTIADKLRLPYTEAVIHEVLRHCNFLKFGGLHTAAYDTRLEGFNIPKGAILSRVSFWTSHDPSIWDFPSEFRPERFIDESGKFSQTRQGFYPFGTGKRQCVGEAVARMELLVFVATLIQNIAFEIPPGKKNIITPIPIRLANLPNPTHELLMTIR